MNTKKNSPACIVLGRGVLSWYPIERISDRYGSVVLYGNVDGSDQSTFDIGRFAGKTGSLIAVVFETRKSHHVGDLFRGFRPSTPEIGEAIVIGNGSLFVSDDRKCVGLEPDDGRKVDWLDPESLYRAHHQTVDLIFRKGTPEDLMWG